MIEDVATWESLFNRLNATCLAMKYYIFTDHDDEEKGNKMNVIWRIFFENMKIINQLAKNNVLDPGEVAQDHEKLFEMHKRFFMFLFNDLGPKMSEDTDFDDMREYLQTHFEEIYQDVDFYTYLVDFMASRNESKLERTISKARLSPVKTLKKVKEEESKGTNTASLSLTKNLREDHIFSKETNSSQQAKTGNWRPNKSRSGQEKLPEAPDEFDFSRKQRPKKIRSAENTEDVFSGTKGQGRIKQNKTKSNMVNTDFSEFDEYNFKETPAQEEFDDPFYISSNVKDKQIRRIKEVQSDVFDSETDHRKTDPFQTEGPRKGSKLRVVDEEAQSESENSRKGDFDIRKPEQQPTTFAEVVDLGNQNTQ